MYKLVRVLGVPLHARHQIESCIGPGVEVEKGPIRES